ncbi:SEC-C motif protein [compost metagenome]
MPVAERYQALSRDALLADYLRVCEILARPALDEETRLTLQQTSERLEGWLELGGRGDRQCPCQSGKRYRNCCSQRLRDSL